MKEKLKAIAFVMFHIGYLGSPLILTYFDSDFYLWFLAYAAYPFIIILWKELHESRVNPAGTITVSVIAAIAALYVLFGFNMYKMVFIVMFFMSFFLYGIIALEKLRGG